MKSFGVSSALSLGAAVISLAGCGGSQAPIGAPGAMPLNRTIEPERNVVDHVAGASSSYQVLHSFGYAHDGSVPDASLIDVNERELVWNYRGGWRRMRQRRMRNGLQH